MGHHDWRNVYEFWFPKDLEKLDLDFHLRTGEWWMRGGATPELPPFAPVLEAARAGDLDAWADTARGRLALIIVLDQFPRGLFAGTAQAFPSDEEALHLCQQGFDNGHFEQLRYPWEQFFFTLPMVHTEGPGHLERLNQLARMYEEGMAAAIERYPTLRPIFEFSLSQTRADIEVIEKYGRYPHRNEALGRPSREAEKAYIEAGDFVHLRRPPTS